MKVFTVPLSPADLEDISRRFGNGEIILIPTDTVYGIAAIPSRADALARIVAAKGRDPSKPCQLLAESAEAVERAGIPVPDAAWRLANAYWPGALTIVLDLPDGGTEGVRVPDDATARALCRAAGGLLRCTSANRSGEPPAQTAEEAEAALPEADAIVRGGRVRGGVASSVVHIEPDGSLRVFREGAISTDALQTTLSCVK